MSRKSLFNQCLQAIDDMTFASPEDLPQLNRRYAAAFATYTQAARKAAPAAQMDRCELCGGWHPVMALAPIDSDYTADRAGRDWSLEREDLLCQGCRCELETEYGTEAPQSFKHWSYMGW